MDTLIRILFMLIITNGGRTQKAHYNCTKIYIWYIVGHGARSIKARYNNKHGQHSKNTPRRTHIRFRIRFRIHFCSFPSAPSTKFTNKANAPLPADGEAAREREEKRERGREREKKIELN